METKLKPFYLAAALEGKKVIYRKGEEVKDYHYFKNAKGPFVIFTETGGEIKSHTIDGGLFQEVDSPYDLFMAPETVTKWVNVYHGKNGDFNFGSLRAYDSLNQAEKHCKNKGITVPITFDI
ncbi:MAG: hypothetical protein ABI091_25810 [Ferruginibacter sp.]